MQQGEFTESLQNNKTGKIVKSSPMEKWRMAKCTKKQKNVENLENGVFNLFTLKIRKIVDKLEISS